MLPDVLNGPTIEKPYNSEDLKWLGMSGIKTWCFNYGSFIFWLLFDL